MPRRLLHRLQPECIREFRAAARQRFDDGIALAAAEQRTGAIYLWGYSAEMILKAAYFSSVGFDDSAPITWAGNIKPAINAGKNLGIAWPKQGEGHNVRAWAEFLVLSRATSPSTALPPDLALSVQRYGQRLEQLWRETLRYHKNYAYLYEVRHVREAAEWYLVNSLSI